MLRLHFGMVNDRGDTVGVCMLPLREATDASLILFLLRTLVLFDLHAVEGAESHWGGRTLAVGGVDGVTELGGQGVVRGAASQEGVQTVDSPTDTKG